MIEMSMIAIVKTANAPCNWIPEMIIPLSDDLVYASIETSDRTKYLRNYVNNIVNNTSYIPLGCDPCGFTNFARK